MTEGGTVIPRVVERILWWIADKAERAAFRMREARRGN